MTPADGERLERIEKWLDAMGLTPEESDPAWLCSHVRALSAQVERLQERVALTSIVGKRAIDAADVKIARLERILAAEQGREGLEGWAYNPTLHAWSRDGASIIRLSDGSNNPWKLTEGESVCTVSHYATAYAAMVSHKEYNALTGRIAEAALAEGAS